MLLKESFWFKNQIEKFVVKESVVLNIGSQTDYFRRKQQPFVQKNIFDILQEKNCKVIHVDIQNGEGVDEVGDVTNPIFIEKLKKYNANVIICSNLLEHLVDREVFCNAIMEIMNQNTIMLFSGPYEFPYHEDPIDTMFRPNLDELKMEFKGLSLVEGEIVPCGYYRELILQKLLNKEPLFEKVNSIIKNLNFVIRSTTRDVKVKKYNKISAICAVFTK